MPAKRYRVTLTAAERTHLQQLITKGTATAYRLRRARILLKADEGPAGPGWCDSRISDALEVGTASVERLRRRFVEDGLEACLQRKQQAHPSNQKFDGVTDAHLIALSCADPPAGQRRWTLRLLADHMVALGHVETISTETIRLRLKKVNSSRG